MSSLAVMSGAANATVPFSPPTFDAVYEGTFELAWRLLRRLGVPESSLDDAAQDVFVTVHRRLGDFEGRSSPKSWV